MTSPFENNPTGYAHRATFKFGPQYKETMYIVSADTDDEFLARLDAAKGDILAKLKELHGLVHSGGEGFGPAAQTFANAGMASQGDVTAAYAADAAAGGPGAFAAPDAGPLPKPAPTGARTCKHGEMTYRSGEKNGRAWSAYFCPAPKGTPDQCSPQWGK